MNVQRGKLVSGGRIQIPAEIRKQLALTDGDTMLIEVIDGEVHLRPQRDAIRRVQERMRKYVVEGRSIVDEFIAERREAAQNE